MLRDRPVKDRDVGEALEHLRMCADKVVIQERQQLVGVVPADPREHDLHAVISERLMEIRSPRFRERRCGLL